MTFRQVINKMGSKINLNINNEWEPKVKPILEKWKKEGKGNFSDKVCEAIVFLDTATNEKIYQAIMQYEAKLELDKIKEEAKIKEQEILDNVVKMMENDEQEVIEYYLTKDKDGPRLNEDQAYDIRNKLLVIINNAEFI